MSDFEIRSDQHCAISVSLINMSFNILKVSRPKARTYYVNVSRSWAIRSTFNYITLNEELLTDLHDLLPLFDPIKFKNQDFVVKSILLIETNIKRESRSYCCLWSQKSFIITYPLNCSIWTNLVAGVLFVNLLTMEPNYWDKLPNSYVKQSKRIIYNLRKGIFWGQSSLNMIDRINYKNEMKKVIFRLYSQKI